MVEGFGCCGVYPPLSLFPSLPLNLTLLLTIPLSRSRMSSNEAGPLVVFFQPERFTRASCCASCCAGTPPWGLRCGLVTLVGLTGRLKLRANINSCSCIPAWEREYLTLPAHPTNHLVGSVLPHQVLSSYLNPLWKPWGCCANSLTALFPVVMVVQ